MNVHLPLILAILFAAAAPTHAAALTDELVQQGIERRHRHAGIVASFGVANPA